MPCVSVYLCICAGCAGTLDARYIGCKFNNAIDLKGSAKCQNKEFQETNQLSATFESTLPKDKAN